MNATVGTCSLCGGRVSVPSPWMGTIPPVPTCDSCGATAASHGPVIPMVPATTRRWVGSPYKIGGGQIAAPGTGDAAWMEQRPRTVSDASVAASVAEGIRMAKVETAMRSEPFAVTGDAATAVASAMREYGL